MVYSAQHQGVAPGFFGGDPAADPTYEAFVAQMTQYTDALGNVSATPTAQHQFGPYLPRLPMNPINNSSEVCFVVSGAPFPGAPGGSEGWLYQPATGVLAANVPGVDSRGQAYFDY
jgi:hypothetical protein